MSDEEQPPEDQADDKRSLFEEPDDEHPFDEYPIIEQSDDDQQPDVNQPIIEEPDYEEEPFCGTFRGYSAIMLPGYSLEKIEEVNQGGKIILPYILLEELTERDNITYPMLFKLTNKTTQGVTHAGVLEFTADEECCFLPSWMMKNLQIEDEGCPLQVESVSLPVASYVKFQPLEHDFLDNSNPKAILEHTLRHFACLTVGDIFAIDYNDCKYEIRVLATEPASAVSCIECDVSVEFVPPPGCGEESSVSSGDDSLESQKTTLRGSVPNYYYSPGFLQFDRQSRCESSADESDMNDSAIDLFPGPGRTCNDESKPGDQILIDIQSIT